MSNLHGQDYYNGPLFDGKVAIDMFDITLMPVMDSSEYLLFFITLFTLFSPPAAIAAFASLTDRFPTDIQKKVAVRVSRNYLIVMIISLTIGEYILMLLGISTPALMITGGIAVFIAGIPMMTYGQKLNMVGKEDEFQSVPRSEWEQVVAVPMTFPMAVGGATIAIAISTSSQTNALLDYGVLIGITVIMAIIIYLITIAASSLAKKLGGSIDILTRVSGIIIVAIAIQILARGISGLIDIYG